MWKLCLQLKFVVEARVADTGSHWDHINASSKEINTDVLQFCLPGCKEWISDTTCGFIERRKKINNHNLPKIRDKNRVIDKQISKSVRNDKRK